MASSTPPSGATGAVDRAHLIRVRAEIGDRTLRRFIAAYLDLLPPRLKHIAKPAESGLADGLRAAYDLRVSSEMLGAARLAGAASEIEQSFRAGKAPGTRQMGLLRTEADAVARTLSGMLSAFGDDSDP